MLNLLLSKQRYVPPCHRIWKVGNEETLLISPEKNEMGSLHLPRIVNRGPFGPVGPAANRIWPASAIRATAAVDAAAGNSRSARPANDIHFTSTSRAECRTVALGSAFGDFEGFIVIAPAAEFPLRVVPLSLASRTRLDAPSGYSKTDRKNSRFQFRAPSAWKQSLGKHGKRKFTPMR